MLVHCASSASSLKARQVHSHIHSTSAYETLILPGAVLDTGDTAMNKTQKSHGAFMLMQKTDNNQD